MPSDPNAPKMMLCTKRRIFLVAKIVVFLWILILIYLIFNMEALTSPWSQHSIIVHRLMTIPQDVVNISRPLEDLFPSDLGTLSFYHLPRKQRGALYAEITSANPDTSYPLAPDFTFHLQYTKESVQLYEDHGPGCIHRVYMLPALPTDSDVLYKMTSKNMTSSFLVFEVDGVEYKYTMKHFMEGEHWPFIEPFSTKHKMPASGMGSYITICYQKSMKIFYLPKDPLPENLFEQTVNCSRNDLFCPVHIYSAVSRSKYPGSSAEVEVFQDDGPYRRRLEHVARILKQADRHGPDAHSSCQLSCMEMCKGCHRTLYKSDSPGVITAIKIRVFVTATGEVRSNWTDILLSATFDNASPPQIDKVPLGSFFGATASLNEFRAAAFGKTKRKCWYSDRGMSLPGHEITGYFYFPMPFWRNVKITLDGTDFIETSLLICSQISVEKNYYKLSNTGYFYAKKTYYGHNVTGYREVLNLKGSWGNIVGLLMDVDNLWAVRNVPVSARWAALQADAVIYLDNSKSASVLGTGLEDYFSYAHGFVMAENSTYAFVGNYHSAPRQKEPLSWHVYRLHVTDPIYFYHSVQIIMEGMSRQGFQNPEPQISYEKYTKRKQAGETCLSHLILYYSNTPSAITTTDILQLAQDISEQEHHFEILEGKKTGRPFHLASKRYLGAANSNQVYGVNGRSFSHGDKIVFTMTCLPSNRGIILRREFHSLPFVSWNEKAEVWVNGQLIGVWFIPMGALSTDYSLREDSLSISPTITGDTKSLEITIAPLTVWRDISYRILNIS